jgi:hypothetical protein
LSNEVCRSRLLQHASNRPLPANAGARPPFQVPAKKMHALQKAINEETGAEPDFTPCFSRGRPAEGSNSRRLEERSYSFVFSLLAAW